MERHREQQAGHPPVHGQPLRHQSRERRSQAPPSLVLEAVDRPFQRPLISRRGASTGEGPQPNTAATVGGFELELAAAARAQRLLQAANQPLAGLTEPIAQAPAATA